MPGSSDSGSAPLMMTRSAGGSERAQPLESKVAMRQAKRNQPGTRAFMEQDLFWGAARGVGGGCRCRRIRGCRWLGGDRVRGTEQDGKRIGAGCRVGRVCRWRD